MSTKATVFAAAAALAAIAGAAGTANAHGHSSGFHPHHRFYFYADPPVRDCSFYREMWEETGLFRWKKRYFVCKGWW